MKDKNAHKQNQFDFHLDAKGLNCPLPILKTKMQLLKMKANEVLLVETTDPHSTIDFEAYCARTNHKLLLAEYKHGIYNFYIKCSENSRTL